MSWLFDGFAAASAVFLVTWFLDWRQKQHRRRNLLTVLRVELDSQEKVPRAAVQLGIESLPESFTLETSDWNRIKTDLVDFLHPAIFEAFARHYRVITSMARAMSSADRQEAAGLNFAGAWKMCLESRWMVRMLLNPPPLHRQLWERLKPHRARGKGEATEYTADQEVAPSSEAGGVQGAGEPQTHDKPADEQQ